MKKTVFALAAVASLAPALASAQAAAASPLTGNMTITSDYRFRGISQTLLAPAIQGGIDYAHSSGLYLGNWNSSISSNQYFNAAGVEMDFYGGYKFPIGGDVTLDVGGIYYLYPRAFQLDPANAGNTSAKYDNFELYVGGAMGPLSAKVFFALTNLFGLGELGGESSKGSYYVDVNYATEIAPKLTLGAHVGYQKVRNYGDLDYVDYKLGLTYDWTGWLLGAAFVGTNADDNLYVAATTDGRIRRIGKNGVVFSIGKTF
ncbi:MAG TPA: TorF family putative porin [Burkholderiaceae bacterium]|nr:TorF family putative porin [Burkholderiaceae bacterium]